MEINSTRNLTAGTKFFMVLSCAFMTGFMWRVRGDSGWGSMWGMFAVGVMLMLFVYAFFGNRRKMSYEAIPAAVILLGITNGGWGTLNSQMGGYLTSSFPFAGETADRLVEINPLHGLWMMLLLGFGWMPLFALFIGTLFSEKQYKIKHYIILVAVYYAVLFLFKASVSHVILSAIHPEAVENFRLGLADQSIELSPVEAYIKNLGSAAWAKKVPFARNYFTSVDVISAACAALISCVAALVVRRDKLTAFVALGINTVCALSITLADVFLILDSDRGFFANVNPPAFMVPCAWSLWEFFTGFLLGLGIMLILVCLPKRLTDGEGRFEYNPVFKSDKIRCFYNALLTVTFTFGLTLARPVGRRIAGLLEDKGILSDAETVEIILTAVLTAIAFIFICIKVKKNMISRGLPVPVAMRGEDFAMKAAPLYFGATALIYFFVGSGADVIELPFAQMKSSSAFLETLRSGYLTVVILQLAAMILFYAFYAVAASKSIKKANS